MSTSLETSPRADTARRSRDRGKSGPRSPAASVGAVWPGLTGGKLKPLSEPEVRRIIDAALDVLARIGVGDPIPLVRDLALARGAVLTDLGRLLFPRSLVEDIIAGAAREITMYGRDSRHDLHLAGERVYFATCGEAVRVPDWETGEYHPSTILDVYDFARLADQLDNIHLFAQTVIATELSDDPRKHDINVAYALLAGTSKHCSIALQGGDSIDDVFDMAYEVAGGEAAFRRRPFLSLGQCPVVSPLRYGFDNSEILAAAVHKGAPVEFAVVPQAGATGPVALAGNLVISTAETLAALILVNLVRPGHPAIVGNWPFVSDLRTGAFSGGSGEEAVMAAAAAQIINYLDLPSHTAAGMSDAKVQDAQAGYEKALANTLAAHAGCNLISESAGMLGSLMACAYDAMIIDNDMLGAIQRTLRGIEVTDETLCLDDIAAAVDGPGHFLDRPRTVQMMKSEFLYPVVADRSSAAEWHDKKRPEIRDHAKREVKRRLSAHYPALLSPELDQRLRSRYPIALPETAMQASTSRWC